VPPLPSQSLVPSQGRDLQWEGMQDVHHTLGRIGMLKALHFDVCPDMGADLGSPGSSSEGRRPQRCPAPPPLPPVYAAPQKDPWNEEEDGSSGI